LGKSIQNQILDTEYFLNEGEKVYGLTSIKNESGNEI